MLLVDTEEERFVQDAELKMNIAKSRPHGEWLQDQVSEIPQKYSKLFSKIFHQKNSLFSLFQFPPNFSIDGKSLQQRFSFLQSHLWFDFVLLRIPRSPDLFSI